MLANILQRIGWCCSIGCLWLVRGVVLRRVPRKKRKTISQAHLRDFSCTHYSLATYLTFRLDWKKQKSTTVSNTKFAKPGKMLANMRDITWATTVIALINCMAGVKFSRSNMELSGINFSSAGFCELYASQQVVDLTTSTSASTTQLRSSVYSLCLIS